MTLVAGIAGYSVLLFAALLFACQYTTYEAGFWLGRRKRRDGAQGVEAVGVVVGGMLALLAFVLALTLQFANARFTDRQAGTLAEANAIGTAWLRATAIGGPDGEAIASLLKEYTALRADYVRADQDRAALAELNARTSRLQTQMWTHLTTLVRERPDPIVGALMASLNDTFDAGTAERYAFNLHLPDQMFWLLIGLTFVSMGCLGYQFGLKNGPPRALVALLLLVWTSVIVNILDLASSRVGSLRAGTAAYEWTLKGFN